MDCFDDNYNDATGAHWTNKSPSEADALTAAPTYNAMFLVTDCGGP
jgi:hypothetical protein